MNRQQKSEVVETLRNLFEGSQAAFLVGYKGLTVHKLQELRKGLRQKGGSMMVAKARLMKRATQGMEYEGDFAPLLKDQISIVFASGDAAAVAKLLNDFAKENNQLKVVAGCVEDRVIDAQSVIRIATLPPREVLLAQLAGTLQAPITKLAGTLNQLIAGLAISLKQVADKKQE